MAVNPKVIRVLNKLQEVGFSTEKEILAMTMDDILGIPGITIADITIINTLQKQVKANRVLSYLLGSTDEKNNEDKSSKGGGELIGEESAAADGVIHRHQQRGHESSGQVAGLPHSSE